MSTTDGSEFKFLMYITCKETDENVTEIYGNSREELIKEFNDDFGELHCNFEIFKTYVED